jgi:hypothetical protein
MADIERMFETGENCDFVIKFLGEKLKAHRDPMCLKSKWFAARYRERFEVG